MLMDTWDAVKSNRSGGLRAQHTAAGDRAFLHRPHPMGTARVEFQSVGRGQRTSTSVKEQVNRRSLFQVSPYSAMESS